MKKENAKNKLHFTLPENVIDYLKEMNRLTERKEKRKAKLSKKKTFKVRYA